MKVTLSWKQYLLDTTIKLLEKAFNLSVYRRTFWEVKGIYASTTAVLKDTFEKVTIGNKNVSTSASSVLFSSVKLVTIQRTVSSLVLNKKKKIGKVGCYTVS